jgi:hypothetical protein
MAARSSVRTAGCVSASFGARIVAGHTGLALDCVVLGPACVTNATISASCVLRMLAEYRPLAAPWPEAQYPV